MKTILIPTDFSENSVHAAEYGYYLAQQVKANVLLCNAIIVPAEMPQTGLVVWQADEYDLIKEESDLELSILKTRLSGMETSFFHNPEIKVVNKSGTVVDVVNTIYMEHKTEMIVIGSHTKSGLSSFVLGSHTNKLIDDAAGPVLIVPPTAPLKPITNIAFATDFNRIDEDLHYIYKLIHLAKALKAKILLTHIYNDKKESPGFIESIERFILELSNKADYPNIYYRLVKNSNPEDGLQWLCEQSHVDMMVMVHRHHNFLDSLLTGSHTHKMAHQIKVPLLVYQSKNKA